MKYSPQRKDSLKKLLFIFTIIFSSALLAVPVLGFNIWTEPSSPEIKDVLVNSVSTYEIDVLTDSEQDVMFHFSLGGPIEDWVSIEPKTLAISRSDPGTIQLILKPGKIPGMHTGYLILTSVSDSPATTTFVGSDTVQLKVYVTENEVAAADADELMVFDMFKGENFNLEGTIMNTGNTLLEPVISVEILSSDKSSVMTSFAKQENSMMPGENRFFRMSEQIAIEPGSYIAKIELKSGDLVFRRELISFNVAESATGAHTGLLQDIQATPSVENAKQIVDVIGTFRNIGSAPANAHLVAVIYQDNAVIDRAVSDVQTVDPDNPQEFTTTFSPKKSGEYAITAYFEYDGMRTVEKSLNINVEVSAPVELGSAPIIIFVLLLLVIVLRFWLKKKEGSEDNKKEKIIQKAKNKKAKK